MKGSNYIKKVIKANIKFSKTVVITCIIFIIIYTLIQICLSYFTGLELTPVLTTSVYAFFGTELASCALIKIFEKQDTLENKKSAKSDEKDENLTKTSEG